MKIPHTYTSVLLLCMSSVIPVSLIAATANQGSVDCGICCRATTGGSSNCRLDVEHCSADWIHTCPSGNKVYCGYFEWNFIACREDTRSYYEECWEYTGRTCENAIPVNALDYMCDQHYIDMQCLELMPK
jgi:hypothetical protein